MSRKSRARFWETASRYLDHHLGVMRDVSPNTVESYRSSLNGYIDYLAEVVGVERKAIDFESFGKENLARYLEWMRTERRLAPRTCNLRMTAIRSMLEYAAGEGADLMPLYAASCTIPMVPVPSREIEYLEPEALKALLAAPGGGNRTDRRNRMILILLYDTGARVAEAVHLKVGDLHMDLEVPYVSLLGKGRRHRNVPLMERTVGHLRKYLAEFHPGEPHADWPLFYSRSHGQVHGLSSDTFEKMIRKYATACREAGCGSMPTRVHCHMLRKTRAMDLYRQGVPLTHIQQLLGHESISTTSGFYAFATLDKLSEALNAVNPDDGVRLWEDPDALDQLYRL